MIIEYEMLHLKGTEIYRPIFYHQLLIIITILHILKYYSVILRIHYIVASGLIGYVTIQDKSTSYRLDLATGNRGRR